MRIVAIVAACAALSGCVEGTNYESVAKNVQVTQDKYTGEKLIYGPWTGLAGQERLRASIAPNGRVSYALIQNMTTSEGWTHYSSAIVLGDRSPRNVGRVAGSVDCFDGSCYTHESYTVALTDADLRRAATAGLDVSWRGNGGQSVTKIPPQYVSAFLASITK